MSTTDSASAPSTTAAETQQEQSDEDAAIAGIEAVVLAWKTFPFESSKGEEGVGVLYLTGSLRERVIGFAESDAAAGQVQRSRGNDRIEVLDVMLDLDAGMAQARVCSQSDHELVNSESGEVIDSDDGVPPGEGTFHLALTDDGWKLSEWLYSGQTEFKECEFSS